MNIIFIVVGILIIILSVRLFDNKPNVNLKDTFIGGGCNVNMDGTNGVLTEDIDEICQKIKKNILMNGLVFSLKQFIGNGKNTIYNADNLKKFQITGDQTISMFVNCLPNGRQNPIAKAFGGEGTITIETGGGLSYYCGSGGGNKGPYQQFFSGGTWNNNTNTIQFGSLTHIAIVRDSKNRKLYWFINGRLVQQGNFQNNIKSISISPLPLTIGGGYAGKFKGEINHLYMFNRALSPTEIIQLSKEPVTNSRMQQYSNTITNLYNTVLCRPPDKAGLLGWLNQYWSGNMTEQQIKTAFINSPEYKNCQKCQHNCQTISYNYKGCKRDSANRSLKQFLGSNKSIHECQYLAKRNNYKYFGLQYHEGQPNKNNGECWADNTFNNQGSATNCVKNANNNEVGSGWSNALYESPLVYNYKGCKRDSANRSLKQFLGNNKTVQECQTLAQNNNYNYFGLQYHEGQPNKNNGQCWADNTFNDQGPATNCVKNANNNEVGSGYSNALYRV